MYNLEKEMQDKQGQHHYQQKNSVKQKIQLKAQTLRRYEKRNVLLSKCDTQ